MDITRREITKIAREVNKFTVRTLKQEGIGSSELEVLHIVRKNPGITQAEVCHITGFDKAAVARQTANLEAKGYLTRKKNPADGRSQVLYALESADHLKYSKASIEASYYEWLLEDLSEEEKESFVRILHKLYLKNKNESKSDFEIISERLKHEA